MVFNMIDIKITESLTDYVKRKGGYLIIDLSLDFQCYFPQHMREEFDIYSKDKFITDIEIARYYTIITVI